MTFKHVDNFSSLVKVTPFYTLPVFTPPRCVAPASRAAPKGGRCRKVDVSPKGNTPLVQTGPGRSGLSPAGVSAASATTPPAGRPLGRGALQPGTRSSEAERDTAGTPRSGGARGRGSQRRVARGRDDRGRRAGGRGWGARLPAAGQPRTAGPPTHSVSGVASCPSPAPAPAPALRLYVSGPQAPPRAPLSAAPGAAAHQGDSPRRRHAHTDRTAMCCCQLFIQVLNR